jgi:hypothetical protein
MNIFAHPRVVDRLDQYLHSSDTETVLAKIPSLFGVSNKATYLGFRALGLSPVQALDTMNLEESQLDFWRADDPAFLDFEQDYLYELQTQVSAELIRLGFLKNMAFLVAKDASILHRSSDLELLTKREYDYLMKVRGHYTPGDLLALEKVFSPTQESDKVTIQLTWGPMVHTVEGSSLGGGQDGNHLPDQDSRGELPMRALLPEDS